MVNDSRSRAQIGAAFVGPDYPAASDFFTPLLSCKAFVPRSPTNNNWAEFCDPRIDAVMRRASAAELTDPEVANQRWALVDRRVVDAAPWVPVFNPASVEIVSTRVGNYQYNPQYGSLLDQLWIR
jgi:peptide/nickel transport system substrate-binding protein